MLVVKAVSNAQSFDIGVHPSITERIDLEVGGAPTPITKEQAVYFKTVEGVEVTEIKPPSVKTPTTQE